MAEPSPPHRPSGDGPAAGEPRRGPFARLFPGLRGRPLESLAAKARQARAALFWEAFWPAVSPLLVVVGLYCAFAWLGVFPRLPDWLRLSVVGLFAVAALAALWPLSRLRLPRRADALTRLERDSGFDHRPLLALSDEIAGGRDDPFARALWQAHLKRVADGISRIRIAAPSPRVDRRDPYAVRALVVLLVFVGLVGARHDLLTPLFDAARLPGLAPANLRIDAWVTPPSYTARAPVFLTRAPAGPGSEASGEEAAGRVVSVPEGSRATVRITGLPAAALRFVPQEGETVTVDPVEDARAAAALRDGGPMPPRAFEVDLQANGRLEILESAEAASALRGWTFAVEPDDAPTIALAEPPGPTERDALRLSYVVTDDHRVAGAEAKFAVSQQRTMPPLEGATIPGEARPLYGLPDFPLSLPRRGSPDGRAETFRDLTAHPFAGAALDLTLEASDDAGNVGRSETTSVTLPQRRFFNPVAKMLVEQRRILAVDARTQGFVADVLGIVTMWGETTVKDAGAFLGLRHGEQLVRAAANDDELRAAADYLWQMALEIEGGDASLAEQRLREAREKLREALQNGASDEEIARLMDELREAMREYMQALAEQMRQNPQAQQAQPMPPNAQMITPDQLERMLDQMQQLSELGDREAAEQLLSQLDRMLENMQTAQPRQGQQGGDPMDQAMQELGRMIQEQQRLMDETFNMSPDGRQNGRRQPGQQGQQQQGQQGPMTPEERAEAMRRLQEGQQALQEKLEQLQEQMRQQGMEPGDQLGEAGRAMGRAGEQLGEGEAEGAVGEQGQALDSLRRGAQQLAEQMGDQPGGQQPGQARSAPRDDPLGRPQRNTGPEYGDSVKLPGEIDVQRARRVLEELRRRFSEDGRPRLELDYLERLLTPEQ